MTVDSRTMLPAQEMMGNLLSAFLSFCPLGACLSDSLPVIFCLLFHLSAGLSYFLFIYFFYPFYLPEGLCVCVLLYDCARLFILFHFHLPRPASEPGRTVVLSSCNRLGCLVANQLHSWLPRPADWKEASLIARAPLYITICSEGVTSKTNSCIDNKMSKKRDRNWLSK